MSTNLNRGETFRLIANEMKYKATRFVGSRAKLLILFFVLLCMIINGCVGGDAVSSGGSTSGAKVVQNNHTQDTQALSEMADRENPRYEDLAYSQLREMLNTVGEDDMGPYNELARRGSDESATILVQHLETLANMEYSIHLSRTAMKTSEALLPLAQNGNRIAIEYLKRASDWNYWEIKLKQNGFHLNDSLARKSVALTEQFVYALGEIKSDEIYDYLMELYSKYAAQIPPLMHTHYLDHAIHQQIWRKAGEKDGVDYANTEVRKSIDANVYLANGWYHPDLPATARCIPGWNDANQVSEKFFEILEDKTKIRRWPLAVRGLGVADADINSNDNVEYILKFFIERFTGEVDEAIFRALIEVPIAIAISDLGWHQDYKNFLRNAISPDFWTEKSIKWSYRELQGRKRDVFIAQLFLKSYPLSFGEDDKMIDEEELLQIAGKISPEEKDILLKALASASDVFNKSGHVALYCRQMTILRRNAEDYWNYPL